MFRHKVPSIDLNLTSIDNDDTQSLGFMSKTDAKFNATHKCLMNQIEKKE